jgi:ABC-type multidrug transport system ATPase subunit
LTFDLDALPQGDLSQIGSDGIALSGGQKQRVSLARALYLQSDFLVLDDIFSGLDANTAETLFRRVFSRPHGLLPQRKTTVILCTHSAGYLSSADHIVVPGTNTVVEQGTFEHLMSLEKGQAKHLRDWAMPASSKQPTLEHITPSVVPMEHQKPETKPVVPIVEEADTPRHTGEYAVYKHYFKAIGLVLSTLSLLSAASYGFFTNFPTICKCSK